MRSLNPNGMMKVAAQFREMGNLEVDMWLGSRPVPQRGFCGCQGALFRYFTCGQESDDKTPYWKQGADAIAKLCGFHSQTELRTWMGNRPKIWGNDKGSHMFHDNDAFGPYGDWLTTDMVADHWEAVANRTKDYMESKDAGV